MTKLNDFYNAGFGWICRHCERELIDKSADDSKNSRLMREGEAESKTPQLSNAALARWTDKTHRELLCPRCGIMEVVDKF